MANDASIRSLARAFDRAWDSYYRSARLMVSQDVARTELARRLVQLSKEGVRDEGSLAKAGLSHLRQLPLNGGKGPPVHAGGFLLRRSEPFAWNVLVEDQYGQRQEQTNSAKQSDCDQ
jgi:hypothetical protein